MRPKPRLPPPYNMTITPVSVLVAILVGGIEALLGRRRRAQR